MRSAFDAIQFFGRKVVTATIGADLRSPQLPRCGAPTEADRRPQAASKRDASAAIELELLYRRVRGIRFGARITRARDRHVQQLIGSNGKRAVRVLSAVG